MQNICIRLTTNTLKELKELKYNILYISIVLLTILGIPFNLKAHDPAKYALSSKMASGKWARIEVPVSGMQFLSNSVISSLGLNPASTNVYGYGGRVRPDRLRQSEPDDLPLLPSVKVDGGIIFYAPDYITWEAAKSNNQTTYTHLMHPYSSVGYVLISDRELSGNESVIPASENNALDPSLPERNYFREKLLHEVELTAPGESGRLLLGEDFRINPKQVFQFPLTGNRGNLVITGRMGAKVSGGSASFMFSANGTRLPSMSADVISNTGEVFVEMTESTKKVSGNPAELNLEISCSLSGMVSIAALDYIRVEYDRSLSKGGAPLCFSDVLSEPVTYTISGCNANTRIWDVTNPDQPIEINPTRIGSTLKFSQTKTGLREYAVFDPSNIGCNAISTNGAATIANQDLHSLSNPHMLIISPLRYNNQANELAELHRKNDGMTVHVLSPEVIYNEFSSGTPDVGAFRKLLKMWADRAGADPTLPYPRYCLLLGRATYDNKHITQEVKQLGYPTIPIWQSAGAYSHSSSYSTDDYIGMTDNSDNSFDLGSQKIRTAVGRIPVKSEAEASAYIEKLKEYLQNPNYGAWRNQVMLIADDQDGNVHLYQMEDCHQAMMANGNGANFVYEKLYLDSYPMVNTATGPTYPAAKERMLQKWNDGVSWIHYIGHANPRSWSHEKLMTWPDITGFSNQNLPVLYAATCEFAYHDALSPSGAEEMLFNRNGGFISTICPSRTVLISYNGTLSTAISNELYKIGEDGKSKRIGDIMIDGKNNVTSSETNKLRFSLLGDPAMRVPSPEMRVVVESIGDSDLNDGDYPVIGARGRVNVTGHIEDNNGNLLSDYNGILNVSLYDAERVITTFGNGSKGISTEYNDRKTRLFNGATTVKNGRWEIKVLMPVEIENNWSPAQLNMYAYSDKGVEANGACTQLYVYGIDADAPEDLEGPGISLLALNNESFEEGDITHSSPLVMAVVSDPSGINISDAGLGHKLLLTLDEKDTFTDIGMYYTPDPEIEGGGRIAYPLSDLTPGDHELKLTVWDNANNSSSKVLPFRVGLNQEVDFIELVTDCNPAHEKVTFTLKTDRIKNNLGYVIEVFNLDGSRVWSSTKTSRSRNDGTVRETWYLQDSSGTRVNRGIYLCRATVECEEGVKTSKTIRLAVAAN